MAASVSIEAGSLPGGISPGPPSGRAGMKSPRSTTVRSASPSSGSDLPATSSRPARLAGDPSAWVTSTNSLPPASAIGRGVVNCQGDDFTVSHLVDVRVHQAGDQGLAEAEAGLDGDDLPVGGDGVGREEDARRLREDHPLHDHGHVDLPVAEAVPQAVGHGPFGEQGGPAPADVLEDRSRPYDVQVRVLLTREGGRRQGFRRRAGSGGGGSLPATAGAPGAY